MLLRACLGGKVAGRRPAACSRSKSRCVWSLAVSSKGTHSLVMHIQAPQSKQQFSVTSHDYILHFRALQVLANSLKSAFTDSMSRGRLVLPGCSVAMLYGAQVGCGTYLLYVLLPPSSFITVFYYPNPSNTASSLTIHAALLITQAFGLGSAFEWRTKPNARSRFLHWG